MAINQHSKPDLLKSVTSGFGNKTSISYTPITDSSVYSRESEWGGPEAEFPINEFQGAYWVVRRVTSDDGIVGSTSSTSYRYAGARTHRQGLGFLGFRAFISIDENTNITKTEILRQDFPYTGMIQYSEMVSPDDQVLSASENHLSAMSFYPNPDDVSQMQTVFPYIESSTYSKWELGTEHTEPHSIITITNVFDEYGNNTQVSVSHSDGGDTFTKITSNTFFNNPTHWILGRLTASTVTHKAPGKPDQTRSSTFTYAPTTGLLMSETIEPGSSLSITTTYARDALGRIWQTTIDPADAPAYVANTLFNLDPSMRFYRGSSNTLGHEEHSEFEPLRGQVLNQTGPNGRTTHFQYDIAGRLIQTTYPNQTTSSTSFAFDSTQTVTDPQSGLTHQSAYHITSTATGQPTSKTWYNAQQQVIRTAAEDFNGNWVYQDSLYNNSGQGIAASENYYAGNTPLWTRTVYDALMRPYLLTAPDGTRTKTLFQGATTTVISNYQAVDGPTSSRDQYATTTVDPLGRTVQTITYEGSGDTSPVTLTFDYDASGNLLSTSDVSGTITSMTYDSLGNKTSMTDRATGTWHYVHDALGRLREQTDARNVTTRTEYDLLGRVVHIVIDADSPTELVRNYYYDDNSQYGQVGALHLETASDGFRRAYYYDTLGRPFLTLSKNEGRWFYEQVSYDALGRPEILSHYWRPPEKDAAIFRHHFDWFVYSQKTHYNERGFVTQVSSPTDGTVWWSNPVYDVHGNLLSYLNGNNLRTTIDYQAATHSPERIRVAQTGMAPVLDQQFQFDRLGNLIQRSDSIAGQSESLTYDRLNRLNQASTGSTTQTIQYDFRGNITHRSDVGAYSYSTGATQRLLAAGGRTFTHNANGAAISVGPGSQIDWNGFNQIAKIQVSGQRSTFAYDCSGARVSQTREALHYPTDGGSPYWLKQSRKTTISGLFEQEQVWDWQDPADPRWDISHTRIHIATPAGVVGTWTDAPQESEAVRSWLHKDHLGSVIAETNEQGEITARFAYSAWGIARDPLDWSQAAAPERLATDRGYTGHQMLDELGLIHMNGRIYDPSLGRFLSADPFVPQPHNLQSHNRYSYVHNNPLSYTDPSGYFLKKLVRSVTRIIRNNWKPIMAIAVAAITAGAGAMLLSSSTGILATTGKLLAGELSLGFAKSVAIGAIGGFAGGMVTGGLRGGLYGAMAGGMAGGIGALLPKSAGTFSQRLNKELVRASAHGVSAGMVSELAGGSFGSGFSGGFAGSMMAHLGPQYESFSLTLVQAAATGGAASKVAGGSFQNGAVTSAFQVMFNMAMHEYNHRSPILGQVKDFEYSVEVLYDGRSLEDYATSDAYLLAFSAGAAIMGNNADLPVGGLTGRSPTGNYTGAAKDAVKTGSPNVPGSIAAAEGFANQGRHYPRLRDVRAVTGNFGSVNIKVSANWKVYTNRKFIVIPYKGWAPRNATYITPVGRGLPPTQREIGAAIGQAINSAYSPGQY